MIPRRALALSVVAALALIGCSDDARQDLEDEARSVASDVEGEVRSAVTDVVDLADETARNAAEVAARNLARAQGGEAFDSAGYPIDGELSCAAEVGDDLTDITIECTGTTEDGGEAVLTGSTSELPGASITELDGTFTGTVDGEEVFSTENLGG